MGHAVTREEIDAAVAEGRIELRRDRFVWIAPLVGAEPIAAQTGEVVAMIPIADIQIKPRHRRDMGDLQELAESIEEHVYLSRRASRGTQNRHLLLAAA